MLDSVLFGKIVGCPWWVGLLVAASAVLPNHDTTKKVMASDNKLKVGSRIHSTADMVFVFSRDRVAGPGGEIITSRVFIAEARRLFFCSVV